MHFTIHYLFFFRFQSCQINFQGWRPTWDLFGFCLVGIQSSAFEPSATVPHVYLYLKHISNVIYWAKTLRKCEVDDKKLLYQLNRHLQCRGMKKTDSCVARKTLNTLWAQFQLTSSSNRVSFQPSYLNVGSSNSSRFYRMMPLLACPWRFLLHFLVASRISSQEIMLSWNFNSKTVQLLQVRVRCHGWYLILFSLLLSESRNHCKLSCLDASYHPRPWEKTSVDQYWSKVCGEI